MGWQGRLPWDIRKVGNPALLKLFGLDDDGQLGPCHGSAQSSTGFCEGSKWTLTSQTTLAFWSIRPQGHPQAAGISAAAPGVPVR